MPRCRFVQPKSVRLMLTEGYFIDVKKELTAGETNEVYERLTVSVTPGSPLRISPKQINVARMMGYILGWNFTNIQGEPVPFSEDALNHLEWETYQEIRIALDDHEVKRAEEKKLQAIASESLPTSLSVA
jgi:hypothetical protein